MFSDVVAAHLLTLSVWFGLLIGVVRPLPLFVSSSEPALHAGRHDRYPYPALVRVYLCRHAQAVAGEPDELRELTSEGFEQAKALGVRLAALPEPPRLVVTSPLIRARQTGAEIGKRTGATVRVEQALAPGATAAALIAALADEPGPIATVGHQPDCSVIALAVIGHDPGFPVAGMAELELIA
jgi:phosphohistidine phosphatase